VVVLHQGQAGEERTVRLSREARLHGRRFGRTDEHKHGRLGGCTLLVSRGEHSDYVGEARAVRTNHWARLRKWVKLALRWHFFTALIVAIDHIDLLWAIFVRHWLLNCGLFNEDTSVLGHWPQSRLGQSKVAAYKRPKIKRAGNAQRMHEIHPHSALVFFLMALLTRAGEQTARSLLQRKYRKIRGTQHANSVPFLTTKQNTHQTSLPAAIANQS
jgi:hypothetical protein